MENIGKRIKQKRKELGYKQTEISEKTGLSQGAISEIEKGKYIPNGLILLTLSDLFCCSVDWLLKGNEIQNQNSKETSDLITKFDKLTNEQKKEILNFIDFKISENERKKDSGESNRQDPA